jgi:hypothetical protein
MKTNHIENRRKIGGDYFFLRYSKKSNTKLNEHLTKFNSDEYYILKSSGRQKVVTYEEMLEFKFSKYTFFRKDLYDIERILQWCNYISFVYLDRPTPPFNCSKIIIKE